MFSSLELLPMWSGVDPDVELYASGVVVDDDGDFSGGQALNGGEYARLLRVLCLCVCMFGSVKVCGGGAGYGGGGAARL